MVANIVAVLLAIVSLGVVSIIFGSTNTPNDINAGFSGFANSLRAAEGH